MVEALATGRQARSTDDVQCDRPPRSDELVSCGAFVTPPTTLGRKDLYLLRQSNSMPFNSFGTLPTDRLRSAFMRRILGGKMGY
jgi:hypothetical protein